MIIKGDDLPDLPEPEDLPDYEQPPGSGASITHRLNMAIAGLARTACFDLVEMTKLLKDERNAIELLQGKNDDSK